MAYETDDSVTADDFEPDDFVHHENELRKMTEQARFGKTISYLAADPSSPFGSMLRRALDGYVEAISEFTNMDLFAADGLKKAASTQMKMVIYVEMVAAVTEAVNAGIEAQEDLKGRKATKQETRGREEFYGNEQPG